MKKPELQNRKEFEWKKYIVVFFITLGIFLTAFWFSDYFANRKINQLKDIQNTISIDILSSETQFSLLSELSCKDVDNSTLSKELNSLAEKISYSEENIGKSDEVIELKKYYSLLQIKDFLLMNKISERCGKKIVSVLYFYTTENNCSECVKQSYVLTELREKYPELRVYSFDYNLDLSALGSLISIYKIEDTKLPATVVGGKLYTGFQDIEFIEKLIPEIVEALEKQKAEIEVENKKP